VIDLELNMDDEDLTNNHTQRQALPNSKRVSTLYTPPHQNQKGEFTYIHFSYGHAVTHSLTHSLHTSFLLFPLIGTGSVKHEEDSSDVGVKPQFQSTKRLDIEKDAVRKSFACMLRAAFKNLEERKNETEEEEEEDPTNSSVIANARPSQHRWKFGAAPSGAAYTANSTINKFTLKHLVMHVYAHDTNKKNKDKPKEGVHYGHEDCLNQIVQYYNTRAEHYKCMKNGTQVSKNQAKGRRTRKLRVRINDIDISG
jgi:hypothetical protein